MAKANKQQLDLLEALVRKLMLRYKTVDRVVIQYNNEYREVRRKTISPSK